MPEVEIQIGDRPFTVACQPGEEAHLQSAAKLLDAEASHLVTAAGRLPEAKMLLMAGLMLADKMGSMSDGGGQSEDQAHALAEMEARLAETAGRVASLEAELAQAAARETAALERLVELAEAAADDAESGSA